MTNVEGTSPYHGRQLTVLLTSVGRRVSLLRHFREALRDLGVRGRVVALDLKESAPALYEADAFELVPRVDAPDYVARVIDACQRHNATFVVPLIDTELRALSESHALFRAQGIELCLSGPKTTALSADKRLTADFFESAGIPTPRLLDIEESLGDPSLSFPLFLKPADGSCSQGAHLIRSRSDLEYFSHSVKNAMLQEHVTGNEYTLDVLVDFQGRVRQVVPRLRLETRAGEVSKGVTVKDYEIMAAGRRVAEALPDARGCITIQCFKTPSGELKFIEINPRFGGGYPLSWAAGAQFPRWLIEWHLGGDPEIAWDGWKEDLAMLRYDDAVYVDWTEQRKKEGRVLP